MICVIYGLEIEKYELFRSPIDFTKYLVMHGYRLNIAFRLLEQLISTKSTTITIIGFSELAMKYELENFGLKIDILEDVENLK